MGGRYMRDIHGRYMGDTWEMHVRYMHLDGGLLEELRGLDVHTLHDGLEVGLRGEVGLGMGLSWVTRGARRDESFEAAPGALTL